MGVSTRLPTGIFDTRKPSSSGYSKSGASVEPMTRSGYSKSGYSRTKFTASKSSYRPSGGQTLMLPSKSGARSRSGRSKTGSKYTSQMKSRTGASVRSASGWVPTGNMVEIDEGELADQGCSAVRHQELEHRQRNHRRPSLPTRIRHGPGIRCHSNGTTIPDSDLSAMS